MEIESIKKTQTGGNLGIKNLATWTGTSEASRSNRIQEMEERISGIEDMIKEMDSSAKKYTKSKKLVAQNIQEIWDTMKRHNLRMIGIEEEQQT